MTIETGGDAPDFDLKDQTGQPVRLSDYHGKKAVVLAFYPMPFTRTCGAEMCAIRDDIDVFQNEEVQTLAISVGSPPVLKAWAEREGFDFPLLSDFWPHGEVARRYGVFNEQLGIAERATFILDRDGTVVYQHTNPIPEARDQEKWKAALAEIGAA